MNSLGSARLKQCRVEDRPEMDSPAEQEEPQHGGQHKLHDGHQQPALQKLAEAGDEKAAQCGNHIAGGTLSGHRRKSSLYRVNVKRHTLSSFGTQESCLDADGLVRILFYA